MQVTFFRKIIAEVTISPPATAVVLNLFFIVPPLSTCPLFLDPLAISCKSNCIV